MAVKEITFRPSNGTCVLALPFTKSGTRFNTVESVILDDTAINRVLCDHFRALQPDALVYNDGSRKFRHLFDDIVFHLRLPQNYFTSETGKGNN